MLRIRVYFSKTEAMRFTSHLDLHKTWERTIRRARLPLAYSQGFSPQPKINLASALPLGFTSRAEVVDLWLEEEVPLDEIENALRDACPPGIVIQYLEQIDSHSPGLQSLLESSLYVVTLLDPFPELPQRLETLLNARTLPRERRGKAYNLRPLVLSASLLPADGKGFARLTVELAAREGATGRPDEVLEALGYDPLAARVERVGLSFKTLVRI